MISDYEEKIQFVVDKLPLRNEVSYSVNDALEQFSISIVAELVKDVSRLERIKTLEEVQNRLIDEFHPTGGMLVMIDRLIEQAKSE